MSGGVGKNPKISKRGDVYWAPESTEIPMKISVRERSHWSQQQRKNICFCDFNPFTMLWSGQLSSFVRSH